MEQPIEALIVGRRGFLGAAAAGAAVLATGPGARAQAAAKTADQAGAAPSGVTFRTVELVGTSVNYAYAAKAGPFLFLNGHESFDFEKGVVPAVEGPAGFPEFGQPKLRREADFLVERMGRVLKGLGSDLQHSVRLDQHYTSADAVRAYHLARFAAFGKYVPPSTSIIMERLFGARSTMSTSLLAVMPDEAWAIKGVYPENAGISPLSGYAPAVTCNDFVFAAGQMASAGGALDPNAETRAQQRWGTPLPIRMQTEAALKRLDATLAAAGASLADCVKAEIHIAGSENFPDFLEVWSDHFRASPCAITVIPAKGFAIVDGIIEINLVALKKGASRRKEIVRVDVPEMAAYGPCVRAGELVLASGLMPIGRDGSVAGAAQASAFDGLCLSGQAQAAAIYDHAEAICKAAGTTMRNVVRAHYYVTDIREFPGIAMAWAGRYGNAPHPFGCVVSPPPMPAPGATVMADFWIYAG